MREKWYKVTLNYEIANRVQKMYKTIWEWDVRKVL